MREEIEDLFDELLEQYKPKFGMTFSVYDIGRSEQWMTKAIALMQQALAGDRGPVTNQDVGFELPDGAIS